MISDFPHSHPH